VHHTKHGDRETDRRATTQHANQVDGLTLTQSHTYEYTHILNIERQTNREPDTLELQYLNIIQSSREVQLQREQINVGML
jgi:hypothetical protein